MHGAIGRYFFYASLLANYVSANTGITVINEYKKEMNIKIQGSGVGGCDIIMQPGKGWYEYSPL